MGSSSSSSSGSSGSSTHKRPPVTQYQATPSACAHQRCQRRAHCRHRMIIAMVGTSASRAGSVNHLQAKDMASAGCASSTGLEGGNGGKGEEEEEKEEEERLIVITCEGIALRYHPFLPLPRT